jgi:hypothetical protein
MSLTLMATPSPQSQIESLQRELYQRNKQLNAAEDALRQERARTAAIERGVQELREILSPLHGAWLMIFGQADAIGLNGAPSAAKNSPVWDSWKQKLGGQTAEAIDILALHGEMNAEQLRIHLSCARTHVYNVISRLNKAGIINKNGGKISLKEL